MASEIVQRLGWWAAKRKAPKSMPTLVTDCKDAKDHIEAQDRRIAELEAALKQCQSVLAMFIDPDTIMETTVLNAYALATAAEAKVRSLISPEKMEG